MGMIQDSVRIRATTEQAYAALTRPEQYRGWWSANCAIGMQVGRESMLHFNKGGTPVSMRFKVDALDSNEHVKWTCVAHDMPSWVGTTLDWSISGSGDHVEVRLVHDKWQGDPPAMVADGWKHFLGSLRAYLETGTGQPW